MVNTSNKYLLAVESAIAGGSIALFQGRELIAEMSGEASVSRAEDLLPRIADLLSDSNISAKELCRVAISLGPGSYTGLRIGIATVLGLCRGLGIGYVGVPLFEAISNGYPGRTPTIAVPMGRSDICVAGPESEPAVVLSLDELKRTVERLRNSQLLVHGSLFEDLAKTPADIIDIGANLARHVGNAALDRPVSSSLDPIYVQNPRFG